MDNSQTNFFYRMTINLPADARDALRRLAEIENRTPREQAAFIIQSELTRHGLLAGDDPISVLLDILAEREAILTGQVGNGMNDDNHA